MNRKLGLSLIVLATFLVTVDAHAGGSKRGSPSSSARSAIDRDYAALLSSRYRSRKQAVRIGGELMVVRKTILAARAAKGRVFPPLQTVPRAGVGMHHPHRRINQPFRDHHLGDLKNFLRFGQSSLTQNEALALARGFGVGGSPQLSARDEGKYRPGDRVTVSIKDRGRRRGRLTRGIILADGGVLAVDPKGERLKIFFPEYKAGPRNLTIVGTVSTQASRNTDLLSF